MMQFLGMLAIALGGAGVAFFLIREEETKVDRISALLQLSVFFKDMVDSYSMPITEIVRSCDKELLFRCGYTDENVTVEMLEENCNVFDGESERSFKGMISDFGKCGREAQVEKCNKCIEVLRKRDEYAAEQLPKKKKLIACISLCAVAAVLILLL